MKNNVFCIENRFDPSAICIQCNVLHEATTVAMLPNTTVIIWVTITFVLDMSRMAGYCLYGTLLLHPHWTVCPIQIRTYHHINVYTDINHRHVTPSVNNCDLFALKQLIILSTLIFCRIPRTVFRSYDDGDFNTLEEHNVEKIESHSFLNHYVLKEIKLTFHKIEIQI